MSQDRDEGPDELVAIAKSGNLGFLSVVEATLRAEDIPYVLTNQAMQFIYPADGFSPDPTVVLVRAEDAELARELMAELSEHPDIEPDEDD